jgi:hypothetical protein
MFPGPVAPAENNIESKNKTSRRQGGYAFAGFLGWAHTFIRISS